MIGSSRVALDVSFLTGNDNPAEISYVFFGTLRSEGMAGGHPLRVLLTALQRNQQVTEIPIGALDASETAVLVLLYRLNIQPHPNNFKRSRSCPAPFI